LPTTDVELIIHSLHRNVLSTTWVQRPIETDCEFDRFPSRPGTYRCTVTYDGIELPFQVRIGVITRDGRRSLTYKVIPEKTVLTKKAVLGEFWRGGTTMGYTEMRCDDDIPAREVVELGPTPYSCYYKTKGSKDARYYHLARVHVTENGLEIH
jgi:hypothetical protein